MLDASYFALTELLVSLVCIWIISLGTCTIMVMVDDEIKTPECKSNQNFLKVCDDAKVFKLICKDSSSCENVKNSNTGSADNAKKNNPCFFFCNSGGEMDSVSWASASSNISRGDLRKRIEPWLSALFQSEHLSLLVGSGLTTGLIRLSGQNIPSGMGEPDLGDFKFRSEIEKAVRENAKASGRGDIPNLEDYLRVMNEVLPGLELADRSAGNELSKKIDSAMKMFANGISWQENALINGNNEKEREDALRILVQFLTCFVSRSVARERLNLFTTNYDRILEYGADIAGIRLIDRFVGSLNPVFRSSRMDIDMFYNPPGLKAEPRFLEGVAHYTKLHGSIDWLCHGQDVVKLGVPFGVPNVAPYLKPYGKGHEDWTALMVYPNAAKDRETAEYPYVELFRDFAAAICRPNSTLVTYGYGFGDEHINRVIRDMLTLPSTHLVMISFDDKTGRLEQFYEDIGRPAQISLLVGEEFGSIKTFVDWYLPKAAIDTASVRMTDIIRSRYEWKNDDIVAANVEVDR